MDDEQKPDLVKDQVKAMIDCLIDIQTTLGLNDKGFYVLLSYHSGVGMKQCQHLVESIFQLEAAYVIEKKKK